MSAIEPSPFAPPQATPAPLARRMRGLSDRAIAWLFIAPTMLLLLAINIFPLIWTIRLSFTNFRANRPERDGGRRRHRQLRLDPDRPRHLGGRCRRPRTSCSGPSRCRR